MIGRIRNLRPRLSGNGQVADEAIAWADRALALAEDLADTALSTSGQLAEARRKWQAAEADQAEGHARIVELEIKLAESQQRARRAAEDLLAANRRANALAKEPHVAELARLQQAVDAYENQPSSISAQDRRNAVVLCDALALAEGRKQGVGYARPADPELVERLLDAVRVTVSQVLDLDLERVR